MVISMDEMIQAYMEETEDMLQKAEECIIRLEMEYSDLDVNELFRIAHTIKGSSHMVGYLEIGNLMHKIEDMLDCARNGSIMFDQSIVSLCFEGLDIVKKMLEFKKEPGSEEIMEGLIGAGSRVSDMIDVFLRVNKRIEEKIVAVEPDMGIVSSHLAKKQKGKNKFYITFFFEDDAPMVSPVIMMILNVVGDIGTLLYSSVGDKYFSGMSSDGEIKTFDIIISTDIDESELYTDFAVFYIEKINIVDLSRNKVEENDYSFISTGVEADDTSFVIILKALMKLYNLAFKPPKESNKENGDIDIMESLYNQAINAFGKMRNKRIIDNFMKDFSKIYCNIIKIYESQVSIEVGVDPDQNLCDKNYIDIQAHMVKLIERAYSYTNGKHIFSIYKCEGDNFSSRLNNFTSMMNKSSTLILLIDLSKVTMLNENEVKDLIEIKNQMGAENIEIGIIARGPYVSRIINVFDSIGQIEEFHVFRSELAAVLGIFDSEDSYLRISDRVKDVQ